MRKVLARLLALLLTLLAVSFSVFLLSSLSPGDSARYVLGEDASEEALEAYRGASGAHLSLFPAYARFLLGFIKGEWGVSSGGEEIRSLVTGRLGVTLSLSLLSLALALLISLPLSFLAVRKGSAGSAFVSGASMAVMSLPSFLIAILLALLFSVGLGVFPVAGYSPPSSGIPRFLRSLFLPSLTLSLMHSSLYTRVFTEALRENSAKPFSRAMVAFGLDKRLVPLKSAFKPSLPVLLSLVAETFATSLGGAAVVETVFALPGLGSLLVKAALSRDRALAGSLVLLSAFAVSVVSLALEASLFLLEKRRRRA